MLVDSAKQMQPDLYSTRPQGDLMSSYQDRELTLRDLVQIFRRRRVVVFGTTGVIFVLGILLCVFSTRRYQATGTIQVQKESSDGLDLESLMGAVANQGDALEADINIQTQASILQSNELALRAIRNLKLEDTEEFRPKSNPLAALLGGSSLAGSRGNIGDITPAASERIEDLS